MPWLDTGDAALRYAIGGDGPDTLLLLHEMGGSLESWDALVACLPARFRAIRHDQRGGGLSERTPGALTMDQAGRDAVALLDALGLDRVVPVGTAVGGALALHLAARHPGRVRAVVATSPATGVAPEARAALLANAGRMEHEGTRFAVDPGLDRGWPAVLRTDPAAFAATRAQRLAASPEGWAATLRMLAGLDMADDLARIACPALILAGEHDLTRPPDAVAPVAAAIPGATFRILASGHFMALQTPRLLADCIIRWLDGLPR